MPAPLTDEQRARIRGILGDDPPTDLFDQRFDDAYRALKDVDPDLAMAWLDSLDNGEPDEKGKGPSVGTLPAEQMANKARRTARWRRVMREASSSPVPEEDSPATTIPDSRRVMISVFLVLTAVAVAALVWFAMDPQWPFGGGQPVVVEEEVEPEPPTVTVLPDPEPVASPEPEPEPGPLVEPPPPPSEPLTFTSETPAPVTPPPPPTTTGNGNVPAPTNLAPGGEADAVVFREPALPAGDDGSDVVLHRADLGTGGMVTDDPLAGAPGRALAAAGDQGAVVFRDTFGEASSPEGGVVFADERGGSVSDGGMIAFSSERAPTGGEMMVFGRTGATGATSAEARVTSPVESDRGGAGDVPAPVADAQPRGAPGLALALGDDGRITGTPSQASTGTGATPATALPAAPAARQAQLGSSPFRVGQRVPARLATSATIISGTPAPVIAETYGSWCGTSSCPRYTFIGRATLQGGNRVVLNFDTAVQGDEVYDVTAIGLSDSHGTSIPAHVRDETPTLAPDLVRASLGGVTQYADALASQQRTTRLADGTAIQESVVPPLEALIAGNLANALDLPESNVTVVRMAEVQPGTPVIIAFGMSY